MILIDTNVVLAALVDRHVHHAPSQEFLLSSDSGRTIIAAHSLAECYSALTRHGANGAFRWSGADANAAIDALAKRFRIAALTVAQTCDAIGRFSGLGIGPRLYDYLIGATGEVNGADSIVTWNVRDFAGLFPALRVATPGEPPVPTR